MNERQCDEGRYANYRKSLISRFWSYKNSAFKDNDSFFEARHEPPVFKSWEHNILFKAGVGENYKDKILAIIPRGKSHKWLRSMTSSQALALSIFGNLQALDKLGCLIEILGDDKKPLFIRAEDNLTNLTMEREINYLGEERRRTSVDAFFGGAHQIAVECKFSEREIGQCSRPKLPLSDSNYCDGQYIPGSTVIDFRSVLTDRLSWGYGKIGKMACAYGFKPPTGRQKPPAAPLSSADSGC